MCCFKPLSFGVICYAPIDYYHILCITNLQNGTIPTSPRKYSRKNRVLRYISILKPHSGCINNSQSLICSINTY